MSWEGISLLSDARLQLLGNVLRDAGYDPRILVTSRHYHEWVVSWIQQYFRPATYNRHLLVFDDQDGGARIPTVHEFFQSQDPRPYHTFCMFDDCQYEWLAVDQAPAAAVRDRFLQFFSTVEVVPFNQPKGDLVTNFVCQVLPLATTTCRQLQTGSPPPRLKEAIPRYQMDYEYLAQAAYDKYTGLAPQYSTRRRALSERIGFHHQHYISQCSKKGIGGRRPGPCTTLHPFPMICMTPAEKQVVTDRLIEYERDLFPNDFSLDSHYEDWLRTKALEDMTTDDKYCRLDVDTTLKEPWWDVFFTCLAQGTDPYQQLPKADQPWRRNTNNQ
jgi:hypothetical protein